MTKRTKPSRRSKSSSTPCSRVLQAIRQGKSFLVTTHRSPDGDALGSALALGYGLLKFKKKVKIYNFDPVPGNLKFLPGVDRVTQELHPEERFDASFIVDCAERKRVGDTFLNHAGIGKLIILDHHVIHGQAGDIDMIETQAASSGVVVLKVLQALKVPITREIATHIYCTLVTDTGNFRYSNTDAGVLQLASDLVKKGVNSSEIARHIYESFPIERLRLMGRVLPTLEVSSDARYASLTLTQAMLQETGATSDLADEFINFPRSVDSVEVAVFFKESSEEANTYKISLRSKQVVDVAAIAGLFDGGGHRRAAGCKITGDFALIRKQVYQAVETALCKTS